MKSRSLTGKQPYFIRALLIAFISITTWESGNAEVTPIRFGATLSLTGPSAPYSLACQRGIELATEDINAEGGIGGAKLEVLIDDFQVTDLKRAAAAAQKFATIDKVVALLPNFSEDAEVIAPIAQRHGIVSMALGAGGPKAARFSPMAFRATSSDGELAVASVRYERAHKSSRLCLVTAPTSYYVDISEEIIKEWVRSGGVVALNESIPYGELDAKMLVTKIRSVKCDSIFVWAAPGTIGAVTAELRRQRVSARRVFPWFADTPEVLALTKGDERSNVIGRWRFLNQKFVERYEGRFKESFQRPAGNCYDGVRVLASVMNNVGTDGTKVQQALLALRDYVGVTGDFIINPDRERTGEVSEMLVMKEGKLEPIR